MSGVNKVILVGRPGKNPEIKNIEGGAKVALFSLATSETWKDKHTGEKKELTEWHNIVLWNGLAETAEKYLHKGEMVYIEGVLRTRSWEDKQGFKRYLTEVIGKSLTLLTPKGGGRPMPEMGEIERNEWAHKAATLTP